MWLTAGLGLVGLVAMFALLVCMIIWVWRDMGERNRPRWLRVVVLLTFNVLVIGFVIYVVDLTRHPHDPNLSKRDVLLQRYRHSPPP